MCVYEPFHVEYLTECDAVARKIPFEDPDVLFYVRVGYVLSQVIVLGAYYYVSLAVRITSPFTGAYLMFLLAQIKKKNDQTVLKYGKSRSPILRFWPWKLTLRRAVEPASPMVRHTHPERTTSANPGS